MGDVAASGGYYIAAPATKILAQPGTITGSIGVIMAKVGGLWVTDLCGLCVLFLLVKSGHCCKSTADSRLIKCHLSVDDHTQS
jgi:hypothetical protein